MSEIEKIQRVFTPDKFNVVRVDLVNGYKIISKDGNLCLSFGITKNTIEIFVLDKCNTGDGGNGLLDLVEKLAESMPNINKIMIGHDDSKLITNCKDHLTINLAILKIVTKGQSWYNSRGYVSTNFEAEQEHNDEILQESLVKLITMIIPQAEIEKHEKKYSREKLSEEIEKRRQELLEYELSPEEIEEDESILFNKSLFDNYDNDIAAFTENGYKLIEEAKELFTEISIELPTRNYVNEILRLINYRFDSSDENMCKKYRFIHDLLNNIKSILLYENIFLIKIIREPTRGGKKYKKQSKKSKKQGKQRKTRKPQKK
jgi:hypothetical protein